MALDRLLWNDFRERKSNRPSCTQSALDSGYPFLHVVDDKKDAEARMHGASKGSRVDSQSRTRNPNSRTTVRMPGCIDPARELAADTQSEAHTEAEDPNSQAAVETQVEKYRRERRQRLHALARAKRQSAPGSEWGELVRFALSWLPFGGPPGDEILVRFGMSRDRFCEQLELALGVIDLDDELTVSLIASANKRGGADLRGRRIER